MFAVARFFVVFYFISSAVLLIFIRSLALHVASKYEKELEEFGIDRRQLMWFFYFPMKAMKGMRMDESAEKRKLWKCLLAIFLYKLYFVIGCVVYVVCIFFVYSRL